MAREIAVTCETCGYETVDHPDRRTEDPSYPIIMLCTGCERYRKFVPADPPIYPT